MIHESAWAAAAIAIAGTSVAVSAIAAASGVAEITAAGAGVSVVVAGVFKLLQDHTAIQNERESARAQIAAITKDRDKWRDLYLERVGEEEE